MPCTASGYVTKTRVNNSLGTWNIPRILFNGIENFLGLGGGEGGGGQGTGREGRVNRRMPGRGRGDVSVLGCVVWGVVSRRVYTLRAVFLMMRTKCAKGTKYPSVVLWVLSLF